MENVDRDNVDTVVYRFCHIFRVNSSPFLLNATLQYHLDTFLEIDPDGSIRLSLSQDVKKVIVIRREFVVFRFCLFFQGENLCLKQSCL